MTTNAAIGFCTVVLITSLTLWSLGLASAGREGPPQIQSPFSSVMQDRQTYLGDNPSEPSYDSAGDDGDDDDDDDLAYTEDNSKEEREDQLDQDDPGNFRDLIYDSFQSRDCIWYHVVC